MTMRYVTGAVLTSDGAPIAGAVVTARLNVYEVDDQAIVLPTEVRAITDSQGKYTLGLWPNSRGRRASVYRVTFEVPDEDPFTVTIVVPEGTGEVELQTLLDEGPYPPVDEAQLAVQAAQTHASTAGTRAHEASLSAAAAAASATSAAGSVSVVVAAAEGIADDKAIVINVAGAANDAKLAAQGAASTAVEKAQELDSAVASIEGNTQIATDAASAAQTAAAQSVASAHNSLALSWLGV